MDARACLTVEEIRMTMSHHFIRATLGVSLLATALAGAAPLLLAQAPPPRPSGPMQEGARLDTQGATADARALFQRLIDSAADPASRTAAQRAMAMSYAFDGDCGKTVQYEETVIDYWKTREQAEPQNAFYQQGEMANEAARVCIDAGSLDEAERWYRAGRELGLKEPAPRTHPASLWEFCTEHALARVAARRGDKAEAQRHVVAARKLLDADSAMAAAQERFFPYLVGYVALYTNDLKTAESELTRTVAMPGNQRDPFMHYLLAMTYEKLGQADRAKALYQQAYDLATAHNPPAAFARPNARRKLGLR
jgi:tetratricopeptide (TPR) repeat protein